LDLQLRRLSPEPRVTKRNRTAVVPLSERLRWPIRVDDEART
jgi:hypothetical protein